MKFPAFARLRLRRLARTTLCGVLVTVLAVCGCPVSGFAAEEDVVLSKHELYGDVVNPLTVSVNDRDCTFVDLDGGKTEGRISLSDNASLYKAAVKSVLPNWASLAYNILGYGGGEDSKDFLYWDHAGKGFEKDFGKGHYIYLYDALSGGNGEHSDGADKSKQSGLSYTKGLNSVYENLTKDIASCIGHKLTYKDFQKYVPLDALSSDKSDQDVIYATIACVDKLGGSYQYDFNGFGIAFYNFKVNQLNSEQALNCAPEDNVDYSYTGKKTEQTLTTSAINTGYEDASQTVSLSRGTAESISTSTTESESFSKGGSWGASMSIKSSLGIPGEAGAEIQTSLSAEATMSQLWEASKTKEESIGASDNQSVSVELTLPAHTAVMTKTSSSTASMSEGYDQPVGISFNVVIFNMNGECYDDNAAVQEFHTAGYDQRSFSTTFGDDTTDAVQSLYMRSIVHRGDNGYDGSVGKVDSWSHRSNNHMVNAIDWDSVLANRDVPSRGGGAPRLCDMIGTMSATYPMSISGAKLNYETTSVDTQLDTPLPIMPISKITLALERNKLRTLHVGDNDPITSYRVHAKDAEDVDYYGFVKTSGEWRVVDKSGKECSSKVISIETDPVTHEQRVIAKKAGSAYVKYFIPEDTYVDCNGNVSTNEDIDSAAYKYVVKDEDPEPFSGTVKLEGSAHVTVGVQENLNAIEGLAVTVYDSTGKEVDRAPSWEAQELESKGIKVSPDGTLDVTAAGTFHVRAVVDGVYSDWAEVMATDPAPDPLSTVVELGPAPSDNSGSPTSDNDDASQDSAPAEAGPAEPAAADTASAISDLAATSAEDSTSALEGSTDSAEADGKQGASSDESAGALKPGIVTLLTDIARYGIDHGLISGTSKEDMSREDYDCMGILYVLADSRGLIPQEAEDEMTSWAHKTYSDDELATWRQHALSVLLEHGYIPQGTTSTLDSGDAANGA